ncbi:hypothetical protein ABIE48_000655 [Paenibacillus sp. OAE614]
MEGDPSPKLNAWKTQLHRPEISLPAEGSFRFHARTFIQYSPESR